MSNMVRINVGCGMSPTAGWLNFDNSWSVKLARTPLRALLKGRADYVAVVRENNVRYAEALNLPVASGTAEILYSSHMLEHLDHDRARGFLAEARRVLKPGGKVRIVVPDLAKYVADYVNSGDGNAFIGGIAMSRSREPSLRGRLTEFLIGFRAHHWMYDARSLSRLLEEAGFADVVTLPPGQTLIANIGELDLYERDDESLYVEATRPPDRMA